MEKYNKNSVAISSANSYLPQQVNEAIDNIMESLNLDVENPFKEFIKPGMCVFIKPNWVASRWRESCDHKDNLYCVITHPAVIEAVADRVAKALDGKGEIIIADNPSIDADFEELMQFTGIRKLEKKYSVPCKIYDLRPLVCKDLKDYGIKAKMAHQSGDPLGEVQVNLGKESLLYNVDSSLFRGVFNEREETVAAHTKETQLYTYSKSLYDADVYISIPKLKTHQKVGATLNLKGLVGSITQKNQLVHWRVGSPETGGDEYPDLKSYIASKSAKVTHRGAHPGNDTIWRMVGDLYQGLLKKDRKYFTIIDGILGGEGQGPFCPTSKQSNVLIGGFDLLLADIVAVRYMGMDPNKIKYLQYFIEKDNLNLNDIHVFKNNIEIKDYFTSKSLYADFQVKGAWDIIKVQKDNPKKKIIGYTTGVYDLFHIGHLNLLRKAKAQCDYLIVGVSTDDLVMYKNKRAVIPFEERMEIVKSIKYVDEVVPQVNMDKMEAWEKLHFDVMFVGDDWKGTAKWIAYEKQLAEVGVKIVYFPYTKGTSSTLINQVLVKLRDNELTL